MPCVFGGTSSDDINFTMANGWSSSTWQHLCVGWYRPTTLTAGRVYFGNTNTVGLRIGSTTSELQFVTDHTTDGVWDTSGAGITVDVWHFIAVYWCGFNTGPADDTAFWVGTLETPPVEISRTQTTAPVGNHTNNTIVGIGNQGSTGAVGFQGEIANWQHIANNSTGTNTLFQQAAHGTLDADAKENVYRTYVLPLWLDNSLLWYPIRSFLNGSSENTACLYHPGLPGYIDVGSTGSAVRMDQPLTINGVTASQTECPRPLIQPFASKQYVRR